MSIAWIKDRSLVLRRAHATAAVPPRSPTGAGFENAPWSCSGRTGDPSVQQSARDALRSLNLYERSDGTLSFVIDATAALVACQLATYDVAKRQGPMFYDPASTLCLPDEVTCAHIIAMVERAQKYFSGENTIVKDGFIFADPEAFELGDRGGHTDTVTSGDGDFLTADTLWDFKVSMSKPTKTNTLQVLMYFLMGKQSGLPEFEALTHIGLFNPRLGIVHRMAVADVPEHVIEIVRRDVIGYAE